jgi:hypothetical protein
MKITKVAKAGKIMEQPPKNPNSGKMDSQIFIGKEDPQHFSKKEKKKKAFNLKKYKESKKSPEYDKSPTEHGFFDECVRKNKDKNDPEAYCASIIDKAKGTTEWRGEDS